MKIPLPPPRRLAGEEMLPLINIVFLLIVFFLLVGQAAPGLRGSATRTAVTTATGDVLVGKPSLIELDAGGGIRWDGTPLDTAELGRRAQQWAREHPQGAIAVQADERASADRVVRVFTELQAAGVEQVRLLARSP